MTDMKWCPFMDKPCVGKMCACAVSFKDFYANACKWYCGMVTATSRLIDEPLPSPICVEKTTTRRD